MLLYNGKPEEFYEYVKGSDFSLITVQIFKAEIATRGYARAGVIIYNGVDYPLYKLGIRGSLNLFEPQGIVGCGGICTSPVLNRELEAIRDNSMTLPEIVETQIREEDILTYVIKNYCVTNFPVDQIRNDLVSKVCNFYKVKG